MTTYSSYESAKCKFENGDIVFFSGGKLTIVRRLIQWFSRGKIYHVGIAFWAKVEDENILLLLEAQPDGVRIVNLDHYHRRKMYVFRCPVSWESISRTVPQCAGAIPYDRLDLLIIGVNERFGIQIPERWTGRGEVCSTLVSRILRKAGFDIGEKLISPQKLYTRLRSLREQSFCVQ